MPQPVKLQMPDPMPLQKMIEPLRRRVRMHHVAVLLGEDVVEILPSIAEVSDVPILLNTVLRERLTKPFWDGDGTNAALGLRLFLTSLAVVQLVYASLDENTLILEINITPLQPNDLAAAASGEQRYFNHRTDCSGSVECLEDAAKDFVDKFVDADKKILLTPDGNRYSDSISVEVLAERKEEKMKAPDITTVKAEKKYFTGTTSKNAVSYNAGEEIAFNLTLMADGERVGCNYFIWELNADDGSKKIGKANGATGMLEVKTSMDVPGFVYLKVIPYNQNIMPITEVTPYNGGAGVEVDKIQKVKAEPEDFDEFWATQLSKLDEVAPELLECEEVTSPFNTHYAYKVKIKFFEGDYGNYVSGYLTVPKSAAKGSLKIRMWYQGHGVFDPDIYCNADTALFSVSAHAIEMGQDSSYYANQTWLTGYGFSNNEDPEDVYFKGMILRDIQALRFMKQYFGENGPDQRFSGLWNGSIGIIGGSQGGFQAIAVSALESDHITNVEAYCPWLCDIGGYGVDGRQKSTFMPAYTPALEYFDTVNFAKRIQSGCVVKVGTVGLGDYVANPAGNTVLYNSIPDDVVKEIEYVQNRTHGVLPVDEFIYKINNTD